MTTPQPPSNENSKSNIAAPRGKTPPTHHMTDDLQIRDPDAVQKGIIDIWGWVEDNVKVLAGLLVILVVGGIVYVCAQAYNDHQEKKAQTDYFAVESKYTKLHDGFEKAKYKAMMPAATAPKDAPGDSAAASGDLAKDYGSLPADFEKVAHDHSGTAAGAQAALTAGQLYLEYKQADKAVELAQMPVKALGKNDLLAQLSRVLWGTALAAKNDCAGAVKVWQDVLDNKSASYLYGEASLRSGVCYETMNQPEKAAEMYRRVTTDGGASTLGTSAKSLLRALEVRTKSTGTSAPQKG